MAGHAMGPALGLRWGLHWGLHWRGMRVWRNGTQRVHKAPETVHKATINWLFELARFRAMHLLIMTHLYRLDASAARIAAAFGVGVHSDPWAGGYVAPEKFAPVITSGRDTIAGPRPSGHRLAVRMVPRLWGVMPPPNSDTPQRRLLSVRNLESPFWIGNLRNSEFRCLIPATALMFWGANIDVEGRRERLWFGAKGQSLFAMAGVWKDEEVPAFAVLTRAAPQTTPAVRATSIPYILDDDPKTRDAWLYGSWDQASRALKPSPLAQLSQDNHSVRS